MSEPTKNQYGFPQAFFINLARKRPIGAAPIHARIIRKPKSKERKKECICFLFTRSSLPQRESNSSQSL